MKYLVMLCDGMADLPLADYNNKTPMELAKKPNMDYLAKMGKVGMIKTVPDGYAPGSDVANLSCMGFDPKICYTGRSPLEAASIGINLGDDDLAFRCNLVTLSDEENYSDKTMIDYSAGDISSKDAKILIDAVSEKLGTDVISFYAGVAYRHCMVLKDTKDTFGTLTPPHDISDRVIGQYLTDNQLILNLMKKSYDILKNHPLNLERIKEGKKPANSIWLWGQGTKPLIPNFYNKWGLKGAVVSAVDLIKGIGKSAGMNVCEVEGATGYIDTNFKGKAEKAIDEFKNGADYVYIHVEAPDECGHRGETENKIKAIELIDSEILGRVLPQLNSYDDYKVLLLPDHPTPLSIKTHSSDPVPYLIYQKSKEKDNSLKNFCEKEVSAVGDLLFDGYKIMEEFAKK
jgi:2,3-bisphosphoglycerate-independent phosphoglycerate mutase